MLVTAGESSSNPLANIPPISITDVEIGRILWLPPKGRAETALRSYGQVFTEPVANITDRSDTPSIGFYNHPILVISKPSDTSNDLHFLPVR